MIVTGPRRHPAGPDHTGHPGGGSHGGGSISIDEVQERIRLTAYFKKIMDLVIEYLEVKIANERRPVSSREIEKWKGTVNYEGIHFSKEHHIIKYEKAPDGSTRLKSKLQILKTWPNGTAASIVARDISDELHSFDEIYLPRIMR